MSSSEHNRYIQNVFGVALSVRYTHTVIYRHTYVSLVHTCTLTGIYIQRFSTYIQYTEK